MKDRDRQRIAGGADRFDLTVVVVIALLVSAIGLVVVRGDQVGLTYQRFGPKDLASAGTAIQIVFDEVIDRPSIESRIKLEPLTDGKLSVVRGQVLFDPATPLQEGQIYTVTVSAGIASLTGRTLKQDVRWQFRVRSPRVVFLGPVDSLIQNLYLVDPESAGEPRQLTFADSRDTSVIGFDVSRDGSRIAYSQLQGKGTSSLFVWDSSTGQSSVLYACPDASCTNPAWRPDGGEVAFERTDLNIGTGMPPGVPRVWILELATNTARPLFTDSQKLGYTPRWTPDGSQIAVYDTNAGGIVLYDFATNTSRTITTPQGEVGQFSPDGRWIFFPKIVQLPSKIYAARIVLVDLKSERLTQTDLVPLDDPSYDVEATWSADSKALVVARRVVNPENVQTLQGAQIYSVDLGTGAAKALVVDPTYSHADLHVSPSGNSVLFQRIKLGEPGARLEIWTYNLKTGALKQLARNGTLPRWIS